MAVNAVQIETPHRRRYPNLTEEAFAQLAERNGWEVTKRGWPDFLCFGPNDEVIAVEVKPRLADPSKGRMKVLSRYQVRVMDILQAAGVRCFVSDGDKLEPYRPERHGNRLRRVGAREPWLYNEEAEPIG
jgi:hypothetical protein